MKNERPKTLIIDIDGTLLFHHGTGNAQAIKDPKLLDGTLSKFDEWDRKGYRIILMTGRRESERLYTTKQLHKVGIVFDMLIMGVGGGDRVVINDRKPNSSRDTAHAVCIDRNDGIKNVDI